MTDIQHTDGVCSSLDALLNCPEQGQTATSVMSAIMRADESSGADQEQLQIALVSSLCEVPVSRLLSPLSPLLSLLPALGLYNNKIGLYNNKIGPFCCFPLSPLLSHLSPLTSHPSPLYTSHLSPLKSYLLPLTVNTFTLPSGRATRARTTPRSQRHT